MRPNRVAVSLADLTSEQHSELADIFAAELQKEIDNEILFSILESTGWIKISIAEPDPSIKDWCDEYMKDQVRNNGLQYYFKDEKDATLFAMRWRG